MLMLEQTRLDCINRNALQIFLSDIIFQKTIIYRLNKEIVGNCAWLMKFNNEHNPVILDFAMLS